MTMSSTVHARTVDLSARRNAGPLHVSRHRTNDTYQPRHYRPEAVGKAEAPTSSTDTAVINVTDLKLNVPAGRPADRTVPPPVRSEPGLERTRVTQLPEQGIASVRASLDARTPMSALEARKAFGDHEEGEDRKVPIPTLERILAFLTGGGRR